jgi:hypothetical protein
MITMIVKGDNSENGLQMILCRKFHLRYRYFHSNQSRQSDNPTNPDSDNWKNAQSAAIIYPQSRPSVHPANLVRAVSSPNPGNPIIPQIPIQTSEETGSRVIIVSKDD